MIYINNNNKEEVVLIGYIPQQVDNCQFNFSLTNLTTKKTFNYLVNKKNYIDDSFFVFDVELNDIPTGEYKYELQYISINDAIIINKGICTIVGENNGKKIGNNTYEPKKFKTNKN